MAAPPRPAARPPPALAGGDGASTILSHLGAEHSHGRGLLGFAGTRGARALRLVCREFLREVADFPFDDTAHVTGPLAAWRASFPRARRVRISDRHDLADADLAHVRGVQAVDLSYSGRSGLPDALDTRLGAPWLTDAALAHLAGVAELDLSGTRCFSPASLAHVRGVRKLGLFECTGVLHGAMVSGLSLVAGVKVLDVGWSTAIDDDLTGVAGVERLNAPHNLGITGACFSALRGSLRHLNVSECENIAAHALDVFAASPLSSLEIDECPQPFSLAGLRGLESLSASAAIGLSDAAFAALAGGHLRALDISFCRQLTDGAFAHFARLPALRSLTMKGCWQSAITDAAFAHIRHVEVLTMASCNQDEISDAAFAALEGGSLRALDISRCSQRTISSAVFARLRGVAVRTNGCRAEVKAAARAAMGAAMFEELNRE